ncbi:MAG: sensor domain-containing diguanylate cyclase [Rhizobacter sp.]|nr:sensor domain-containing diguanylate cyclase [Burkholderiales bacterium]
MHLLKRQPSLNTIAQAEQSLLAETLLRSCAHLLDEPEPQGGIEQMCAAIVAATPHIPLVWAWFGASDVDVIEPQIAVGCAREYVDSLRIKRNFLTELGPAFRALNGHKTRAFDVSPLSPFAPWRDLARRFGICNVLVVPITNGDDERGLLALHSTRPHYFEGIGVGLFDVLGQLFHAVLKQSRRRAQLEAESQTDVVTGLPTRRHAQRRIDDLWKIAQQHDNRGVLIMIDVDGFKSINDTFGHQAGDIALRHVAAMLQKNVRSSDILSRWGGDEFLAWMPAMSGASAMAVAEQLRLGVADDGQIVHTPLQSALRISVGATAVPATEPFASALDRVDRALMRAKQNGRNCVVVAKSGA